MNLNRPNSTPTQINQGYSCSKHIVGFEEIDIAKKKAVSKRGVGPGSYEVTRKDIGSTGNY